MITIAGGVVLGLLLLPVVIWIMALAVSAAFYCLVLLLDMLATLVTALNRAAVWLCERI